MSHEEEVVRNAYARFSFFCSMPPITKVAGRQLAGVKVDEVKLQANIEQATPVYELSGFKVGPVSEIANEAWGAFITVPRQKSEVLQGGQISQYYSDNSNRSDWEMAEVKWAHAPQVSPEVENIMLSKTVAEIIKLASPQWQDPKDPLVTYSRYAAFTVDVSLQDRSSGPHKAIFFFGTDSKRKEYVAPNDLISSPSFLSSYLNSPSAVEPEGLLLGKFREAPVVADWLRANLISDSNCSQTGQTLCCSHGHCGISSAAYNRGLATPLPAPKY